ncbi:MAG: hypothetical protein JKY45_00840, partial [Emcibacter sp.]|nr:hypothetical protein [Emcibacter sp.]
MTDIPYSTQNTLQGKRKQRLLLIAVFIAVIFFSGAYIEQLIFGPGFSRNNSMVNRAINASKMLPLYLLFGLVLFQSQRKLRIVINKQIAIVFFSVLYVLSTLWSAQLFFSFANALFFMLTIVSAWGVAATIPFQHFFRAVFWSFMFIAVGSLVYIVFIPSYGVMRGIGTEALTTLAGMP